MDVAEIRAAALASGAVAERMRGFRQSRLADVVSGQTPVDMSGAATVVLHVLPLAAFDSPAPSVDLEAAPRSPDGFLPLSMGGNFRHNFDGLLCHGYDVRDREAGERGPESYALLFRSGAIEAADTHIPGRSPTGMSSPPRSSRARSWSPWSDTWGCSPA